MPRDTLRAMLLRIASLQRDGESFRCSEGHDVTLFIGELGRAMVVGHVQSVALLDTHVEVSARDRGTLLLPYEAVQGVQYVEGERKGGKRAGVGFGG
jgi:hypothetical protein